MCRRIAMLLTKLSLRLLLTEKDYACFKEALKCAEDNNRLASGTKYIGAVKHLLSVNRSIKRMVDDGRDRDEVVGAVVHLAVSLKYLESRNE
jgi:hypothetical protein